jgi:hypothetical protein
MHAPHVIPQEITEFQIQLMHILAAIAILSSAIIGFVLFIPECAWSKF